ncbi:MAG TPA: hypothetical protein VLW26_10970 [Steroidobacteraceae bacterium]|nr:hypothetical protein [Steroidobacteraceae bacterium]
MQPFASQRAQIGELLDAFIADQQCVPLGAARLECAQRLPESLQRLATRATESEDWRAWTGRDGGVAFLRGKLSSTFSRQLSRPAIHIFLHSSDGEIADSGTWARDEAGRWAPCKLPGARPGRRSRVASNEARC